MAGRKVVSEHLAAPAASRGPTIVVADRSRPASLHHFWDTGWVARLGVPLDAADERKQPHRAAVALARVFGGGFGFALILIARPSGWSISNAPVFRTRSLSFRLFAAGAALDSAIALGDALRPFRHGRRTTAQAVHPHPPPSEGARPIPMGRRGWR
jgi:hypothetical protein